MGVSKRPKPTPRSYGYGRYVRIGWSLRVALDPHGPLGARWRNSVVARLRELPAGVPIPMVLDKEVVEYAGVLDGVVSTLRDDFAEAPEQRR